MVVFDELSTLCSAAMSLYVIAENVNENREECLAIKQTVDSLAEAIKRSTNDPEAMPIRVQKITKYVSRYLAAHGTLTLCVI